MELHNDQVPGDIVWATVSDFGNVGMVSVDWYLTAEMSSEEYRRAVAYMTAHSGGLAQRWKVTLPRRRMDSQEVGDYVMSKLMQDPDGTTQLLDISIQSGKE
ncbi:MAG TPA: hypothetical protein VLJ40_11100 [Arthrobacter sp.]|nr:hypothetical protein [Arthrobacter sp.]